MKLKTKLPAIVIPLIVFPLLITGYLAYTSLKAGSLERAHQDINRFLGHLKLQWFQVESTAKANVRIFSEDFLLQNYLLTDDDRERYALLQRPLQEKFNNIQKGYPDYYEIRVLLPDGYEDLRVVNRNINNTSEYDNSINKIHKEQKNNEYVYSYFSINPDNQEPALYISKCLYLLNRSKESYLEKPSFRGCLSLTISLDRFLSFAESIRWSESGIIISNYNNKILWSYNSPSIIHKNLKTLFESIPYYSKGKMKIHHLENNVFHQHSQAISDKITVHLFISERELVKDSEKVGHLVITISILAILFSSPFLIWFIRSHFLKPVQQLNQAFYSISHHSESKAVKVKVLRDDEVGALSLSFNKMSHALFKSDQQIRKLAFNDSLTGLPNRLKFSDTLRQRIEESQRLKEPVALLFLDLDNFKAINDTQGHHAGDQLLIRVAEVIQSNLRCYDAIELSGISEQIINKGNMTAELSRLGGDEFTIILSHLKSNLIAGQVAQRIIDALTEPFELDEGHCYTSCSIGIALYPSDGENFEDLVKFADLAMYQAKLSGKNHYQYFSKKLEESSRFRAELDLHLHQAIEQKSLTLFYQPIVDARSCRTVATEALIRWYDPELGSISPDQFIPLAEENGMILPIGDWVLETAIHQLAKWQKSGIKNVKMTVNVSAVQLNQPDLPEKILNKLNYYQLDTKWLYLELTESALLSGDNNAIESLNRLRAAGVQIALDDFGTGYSSLSYLQRLPIDILKIDRSFIQDLQKSQNFSILHAIITMAHSLELKIVAEGIEDLSHQQILCEEGCDFLQGYLFCMPGPEERIRPALSQTLPIINDMSDAGRVGL